MLLYAVVHMHIEYAHTPLPSLTVSSSQVHMHTYTSSIALHPVTCLYTNREQNKNQVLLLRA